MHGALIQNFYQLAQKALKALKFKKKSLQQFFVGVCRIKPKQYQTDTNGGIADKMLCENLMYDNNHWPCPKVFFLKKSHAQQLKSIQLINIKMPIIVGILTSICKINAASGIMKA